jgi:hypothetical protein
MIFELKLALIISMGFLFLVFVALMIVMRSIGNINHAVNRIEEIVSKEVVLNFNRHLIDMKADKQRKIADVEKKRRQEALLNIPLTDL